MAATLFTGLAPALPVTAAELATSPDAQVATAKNLPGVKVEATTGNDYRVDKLSSPKYTQPLLDTTQTISVITKELRSEERRVGKACVSTFRSRWSPSL